jgi:aldehyde:ferredoxin oxidoreductase
MACQQWNRWPDKLMNYFGILPTKNFRKAIFDGAENFSGEALKEKVLVKNRLATNALSPARGDQYEEQERAGRV